MDLICLPVRYDELTEEDIQAHLRYCAASLRDRVTVEFIISEAGVIVPAVKRVYLRKPTSLVFLARSGSLGRDGLIGLRSQLESQGYDLNVSFTKERRLLRRIEVPLSIEESLLPLRGIAILRTIALQLRSPWPGNFSVAYAVGSTVPGLPGRVNLGNPLANAGYKIGRAMGNLVRKVISG
jgi:hypothetical protein